LINNYLLFFKDFNKIKQSKEKASKILKILMQAIYIYNFY